MYMNWNAGEREFSIYLSLNGPTYQSKVAESYGIAGPTVNLAKDSLVERGLIRLLGTVTLGRGAPRKVYGLTPAGLIAAMLEGDLWGSIHHITRYWDDIAPVFIRCYREIRGWGLGGDVEDYCRDALARHRDTIELIGRGDPNLRCYAPGADVVVYTTEGFPVDLEPIDPWDGFLRILERGFYSEMYRTQWGEDRTRYLRMVKSIQELREGWLAWYRGEEERLGRLREHRGIILDET